MRKVLYYFSVAILSVVFIKFFYQNRSFSLNFFDFGVAQGKPDIKIDLNHSAKTLQSQEVQKHVGGLAQDDLSSDWNNNSDDLKFVLPDKSAMRKEVAQNPHSIPMTLIRFSIDMSKKFKLAVKSEESSRYYLAELEKCVQADPIETVASVQSLCILQAKEVARRFPGLTEMVSILISHSRNDRAVELANVVNSAE